MPMPLRYLPIMLQLILEFGQIFHYSLALISLCFVYGLGHGLVHIVDCPSLPSQFRFGCRRFLLQV